LWLGAAAAGIICLWRNQEAPDQTLQSTAAAMLVRRSFLSFSAAAAAELGR
jgi:hypothetical protein